MNFPDFYVNKQYFIFYVYNYIEYTDRVSFKVSNVFLIEFFHLYYDTNVILHTNLRVEV